MKTTKLTAYLTTGIAAAATGQADAATLVTLYGPGAQNSSSDPATPAGISIGLLADGVNNSYAPTYAVSDIAPVGPGTEFRQAGPLYFGYGDSGYFTTGGDNLNILDAYSAAGYYEPDDNSFVWGAVAGMNYANISFDGDDDIYEAVGQFFFDGQGGGYLVALAVDSEGDALSISAGKAAIDAIPEPTTTGLLALGAAGLALLRRRKA